MSRWPTGGIVSLATHDDPASEKHVYFFGPNLDYHCASSLLRLKMI